jgi:heterodisulfide reductase subunit B
MQQVAPLRTLIKTKEVQQDRLLTLCSMCYNTLKQAQRFIQKDPENRDTINTFMDREIDFSGDEVEVIHLLTLFEDIGIESLKDAVQTPVEDFRFAPYYGCLLTRPKEVSIAENIECPTIMENVMTAAGFESVYFPFKTECCASFQVVNRPDIVKNRTRTIVTSAVKNGADAIIASCPLCLYNLDAVQQNIQAEDAGFQTIPVLYFTQLLAFAYNIDPVVNDFSLHAVDPRPLLQEKGLL